MRRASCLMLALLALSTAAFAQSASTDSQTLQSLLSELRQMRKDLQSTTVASQRVQILLYRLQSQQAAVARAQQRVDELHSKLAEVRSGVQHFTTEVERAESEWNDSQNPAERKQVEVVLTAAKRELESQKTAEQDWETKEAQAIQYLRSEEAKLAALEEQLDRLDTDLARSSH